MARFRNIFQWTALQKINFKSTDDRSCRVRFSSFPSSPLVSLFSIRSWFASKGRTGYSTQTLMKMIATAIKFPIWWCRKGSAKPIVLLADKKCYTNNSIGQPHNGLKIPKESNLAEKYNKMHFRTKWIDDPPYIKIHK